MFIPSFPLPLALFYFALCTCSLVLLSDLANTCECLTCHFVAGPLAYASGFDSNTEDNHRHDDQQTQVTLKMPIYYTKVDRNASDSVRFLDKKNRFGALSKLSVRRSSAIELNSPESNFPLISCPRLDQSLCHNEELVDTSFGSILVAHQGAKLCEKKPIIVTLHDMGMNHSTNFEGFFEYPQNKVLLQSLTVLHINLPGQQRYATTFPDNCTYPSMEDLVAMVKEIATHFEVTSFIAFGSGVGANILIRFALRHPSLVEGLILHNPCVSKASWTEWAFQKKNIRAIKNNNRSSLLPESVQEFLMWYHFGETTEERIDSSKEAMQLYRSVIRGIQINPYNLSLLVESFISRDDLAISRVDRNSQPKCPAVLVVGAYSTQMTINESVYANSKLDPANTTWIKLSDCGMPLEEKPGDMARVMRLFLQGLGYTLKDYEKSIRSRGLGLSMPCLAFTPSSSTGTSEGSSSSSHTISSDEQANSIDI